MGERAIETNDVNSSTDIVTRVLSLTSCRNSLVGDKVSPLSLNQPYSRGDPSGLGENPFLYPRYALLISARPQVSMWM